MQDKVNEYLEKIHYLWFPYPQYTKTELNQDYVRLNQCTVPSSNAGLKIIKAFHPSIWRCNIKGHLAPIDAWNDDYIMTKVILNRFKYLNTDVLSLENLLTGLSVTKLAPKVSIFRPALAKYLINKYLYDYNIIFDPCAGFSGRLLGAHLLNKRYIGYDINSVTVEESKRLARHFDIDAKVLVEDSLYASGKFKCLFTCPPYGDKENWHQDIEVLSTDDWVKTCLKNFDCDRYLFVIDDTKYFTDYIVESINNKSHFGTNSEIVILFNSEQRNKLLSELV